MHVEGKQFEPAILNKDTLLEQNSFFKTLNKKRKVATFLFLLKNR